MWSDTTIIRCIDITTTAGTAIMATITGAMVITAGTTDITGVTGMDAADTMMIDAR